MDGPHTVRTYVYAPRPRFDSTAYIPVDRSNRNAPKWSAESRGAFIGSPFTAAIGGDVEGHRIRGQTQTMILWAGRLGSGLSIEVRSRRTGGGGRACVLGRIVVMGSAAVDVDSIDPVDQSRGRTVPRPFGRSMAKWASRWGGDDGMTPATHGGRMAVFLFLLYCIHTLIDRPTDPHV